MLTTLTPTATLSDAERQEIVQRAAEGVRDLIMRIGQLATAPQEHRAAG